MKWLLTQLFEIGGFFLHFFDRDKVERLARGFEILEIHAFTEGPQSKRLFRVTLRKREPRAS